MIERVSFLLKVLSHSIYFKVQHAMQIENWENGLNQYQFLLYKCIHVPFSNMFVKFNVIS